MQNEAVAHRGAVVGILFGLLVATGKHEAAMHGVSLTLAYTVS